MLWKDQWNEECQKLNRIRHLRKKTENINHWFNNQWKRHTNLTTEIKD